MKNRTLFEQIEAVDAPYINALTMSNLTLEDIQRISDSWETRLETIVDNLGDSNIANESDLLEALEKGYPEDYISPIFKEKISRLQEIKFSIKIDKKHFKTLKQTLLKCKTPDEIERAVRKFRNTFEDTDGLYYSIEKNLKPRHPLYYKLRNYHSINADKFITALTSILHYPNFYNSSTVFFALAVSAGLGLTDTFDMQEAAALKTNTIRYRPSEKSRKPVDRVILCTAKDFCRAQQYVKAQGLKRSYAKAIDTSIPESTLGLKYFSFKTIPALYQALCEHFGIEASEVSAAYSRSKFIIEGIEKIENAQTQAAKHLDSCIGTLMQTKKSHVEKIFEQISIDPEAKVTARKLMEWLSCAPKTALDTQNLILEAIRQEPI